MRWEEELNPQQLEAVRHGEGPLMVLAGAGSGKTRVITYRIARLVTDGVAPYNILAVTFTNKAAEEMRHRVLKLVGAEGVWISTFHSLGARLLRRHAELAGRTPDFVIYDEDDSRRLGKKVMQKLGLNPDSQALAYFLRVVEKCKHQLRGPDQTRGLNTDESLFYREYQQALDQANAFDFADLIFRLHRLWQENASLLEQYRRRFRWVLVDEFQDTDRAQAGLLELLCPPEANLCVVGDDDQAIYNWRDADVSHILNFQRHWPAARVVRLERNYRSTSAILEVAFSLIRHNHRRHAKKLWTDMAGGPPVRFCAFADDYQEAESVAREVLAARQRGESLSEMAVLYRVNAQSRVLEEVLRLYGLPYRVVGGVRFFERQEIKDVLAYLRLALNPDSDLDLLRVINVPARGIGDTTRGRLEKEAARRGVSIWRLIQAAPPEQLRPAEARRLQEFRQLLLNLQDSCRRLPAAEGLELILRQSGYWQALESSREEAAEDRLANVMELVNSARQFAEMSGDESPGAFLEHVALFTAQDTVATGAEMLNLMTLHSAKGLEFYRVFIVGLEEQLLPHWRAFDSETGVVNQDELEEERRLLYVGITRARRELRLSCAEYRTLHGQSRPSEPSRFLEEIAQHLQGEVGSGAAPYAHRQVDFDLPELEENPFECDDDYGQLPSDERSERLLGRSVEHPVFGRGRVLGVRPGSGGLKLEISFEQAGQRTVLASWCKIHKN